MAELQVFIIIISFHVKTIDVGTEISLETFRKAWVILLIRLTYIYEPVKSVMNLKAFGF